MPAAAQSPPRWQLASPLPMAAALLLGCGLIEPFPELAPTPDASTARPCEASAADAPLNNGGLVALYRGSGVDLSGHGIDAHWHGTPSFSRDRFMHPDLAASLDATAGTYLEVPAHPLVPTGTAPRTVSAWFLTSHMFSPQPGSLVNWGRSAFAGQRFGLLVAQPGEAYFVGESADLSGGPVLTDGRWHNVVVTYDGRVIALYVDVALAASGTAGLNTIGDALELGRSALDHSTPEYFTGALDEVRIYDRVLDTAERRALYFADGWQ